MTLEKLIDKVIDYSEDERDIALDAVTLVAQNRERGESIDDLILDITSRLTSETKAAKIADILRKIDYLLDDEQESGEALTVWGA